jgi:AraC-like DNA-binding protein
MSLTSIRNAQVSGAEVLSLLKVASIYDARSDLIARRAGIDISYLLTPNASVDASQYYLMAKLVAEQTDNPDLFLYVGRVTFLETSHISFYMASMSRSLRDWLNMMPRACHIGESRISRKRDLFSIQWHPQVRPNSRRCGITDSMMALTALRMDNYCLLPVKPVRVDLSYEMPADLSQLKAMLGENLHFNQPISQLWYDQAALDYPMVQLTTQLYDGAAEEYGKLQAVDATNSDPFLKSVDEAMRHTLPMGECSIKPIAIRLNISRRTLQRRLEERGTNFQKLLQKIKVRLSKRYLEDSRLSIIEIAFLLGYSDPSTFSTAFKSWQGISPTAYRQSLDSGLSPLRIVQCA